MHVSITIKYCTRWLHALQWTVHSPLQMVNNWHVPTIYEAGRMHALIRQLAVRTRERNMYNDQSMMRPFQAVNAWRFEIRRSTWAVSLYSTTSAEAQCQPLMMNAVHARPRGSQTSFNMQSAGGMESASYVSHDVGSMQHTVCSQPWGTEYAQSGARLQCGARDSLSVALDDRPRQPQRPPCG